MQQSYCTLIISNMVMFNYKSRIIKLYFVKNIAKFKFHYSYHTVNATLNTINITQSMKRWTLFISQNQWSYDTIHITQCSPGHYSYHTNNAALNTINITQSVKHWTIFISHNQCNPKHYSYHTVNAALNTNWLL